ncbi:hypothetical protein NCC78_04200 [Micromonospora phytophila]|uniref:hypothetical protein n=1 Tax=Micromonospora phytophila TaxID=709888 RepID=UPI002030CB45|nr:hypothetical protein [Micromonospora phytophila]MCM0673910.1 hypothetical protein [Micromonospora phytophila]
MGENAQQRDPGRGSGRPARRDEGTEPDVLLDIPRLSVDSIRLAVDGLDADLSLRARLANLLQLDAGVRVHLRGVELDITGVRAEALLKVRLEKLVDILDRAMTTIDRNPQIIEELARTAKASIGDVNRAAQQLAGGVADITAGAERRGGATDEFGQQVGAIGAVADRPLRRPGGPTEGGERRPPVPSRRGGGLASGSGGGGERGQEQRAQEQREREQRAQEQHERDQRAQEQRERDQRAQEQREQEQRAQEQREREQREQERQGRGEPQPGGEGQATPGARQQGGPGGAGEQGGARQAGEGAGPPSAAQLAEQSSQTLRQAGRSVWEAIQEGMAQHRQQGR